MEKLYIEDLEKYTKLFNVLEIYTDKKNITDLCFKKDLGYDDGIELYTINVYGYEIAILEKGGL